MARITIKELEQQIQKKNKEIETLNNKLDEVQYMCKLLIEHKNTEIDTINKEKVILLDKINAVKKIVNPNKSAKDEANESKSIKKGKLTDDQIKKAVELRKKGISYGKIAPQIGISKSTIYTFLKSMNL